MMVLLSKSNCSLRETSRGLFLSIPTVINWSGQESICCNSLMIACATTTPLPAMPAIINESQSALRSAISKAMRRILRLTSSEDKIELVATLFICSFYRLKLANLTRYMQVLQQILFIVLLAAAIWLFARKVKFISRNIRLGRDEDFPAHPDRWKNVLLIAFGQKRMFDKPLVAL